MLFLDHLVGFAGIPLAIVFLFIVFCVVVLIFFSLRIAVWSLIPLGVRSA